MQKHVLCTTLFSSTLRLFSNDLATVIKLAELPNRTYALHRPGWAHLGLGYLEAEFEQLSLRT